MNKLFLAFCCVLYSWQFFAQQTNNDILLTIDNKPVYISEFKRVYNKNLDLVKDKEQRDVSNYLQLFIDYKLKVLEAKQEGLDTLSTFVGEYNIYKKQLADKFLIDSTLTEQLLKEAYQRLQQEVNASHILIAVGPDAAPKDTLIAYQKIMEARNKIINGESFQKIADRYSQDPSVRSNHGNLGWFGVFRMVYPFENAAYSTKVGEVSLPIRTQFGYHLVKVNDKRKAEGKIEVAQIMINGDTPEAKKQLEEIYKKALTGTEFSSLAKQFSDDKNTAVNGGKMNAFKKGDLQSIVFENKAFALSNPGEISKPFKTRFGWHIVKLIKKFPIKSFEEEKPELEQKIKNDSRSKLLNEKLIQDLNQRYQVIEKDSSLSYFKKNIDNAIVTGKWDKHSLANVPDGSLISIHEEAKSYSDFVNYIAERQRNPYKKETDKNKLLEKWYQDFKNFFLVNYHKDHLATINPTYAAVAEEYKNGLLIFDLMQKKVWNASKEDTMALREYYQNHKERYQEPKQYKAQLITADSKKLAKKIRKKLKHSTSIEVIKKENPSVIVKSGIYNADSQILPNKINDKLGVSKVYANNNLFLVLDIEKIIPQEQSTFEEAKGYVAKDFQDDYEEAWIKQLRNKHSIIVNQEVLKKVKQQFEN